MVRTWSVLVGVVGILGTGTALRYLQAKYPEWEQRYFWFLGLAALFPGWMIAFLGLLQPLNQRDNVPLPPPAILSSGAGLLGIIVTDYVLRRFQNPVRVFSPSTCWRLGYLALLPAWLILLLNL
jgi:amino acid transporter